MAWYILKKDNITKIYKKRKKLKYFFYAFLKYNFKTKLYFKEEILAQFINKIEKENLKILFFTPINIIKNENKFNTLFIIIWKESFLIKEKNIEQIFEKIINELNLFFNYELTQLNDEEIRIIFEKIFPFNII